MSGVFSELLKLILIDSLFVGLCLVALLPLSKYKQAAFAILKRNFVGYFMNPTGYVFLCLFVLLSSLAAFWPHEFFAANLASLHQLNLYLPYIMLVFIPAITMSIWADERRQGTDELLLTLPADDFDVVTGKYLAAVAIFTCSLLFAQISHYMVLILLTLGELDTGLLCATYFGYWLTGLAMISVGMVASFLTRNLTVGFILGALFNAPLVFLEFADVIVPGQQLAHTIAGWSIAAKFDDFGRGVVSLSSVTYFIMIIVLGLYLSMVFIGSRHWWGGRDGTSLIGHYFTRTASLVLITVGATVLFSNHDVRKDMTRGRVSSLSPDTLRVLANLKSDHPVRIEAYISARMPEQYVQTANNLRSLLKEFASRSPQIRIRLHDDIEPFSDEAEHAELRYEIRPQTVQTRTRGAMRDEQVILGAAFTSGLEKVVVPFFEYGVPVEYELIRSISTVAKSKRPKLGVIRTDAQLFATASFTGGDIQQIPQQAIIDELQKQYDLEQIDPATEIELGKYAAILAVQPSSLPPEGLDHLLAAIQAGQPTAIFEDPLPVRVSAPGTGDPRRSPGMMGMMGQAPQPKGEIQKLWDLLGIDVPSDFGGFSGTVPKLTWQSYNPYPKLQLLGIPDEWVFASLEAVGGENSINQQHPITSGLKEILLPVPGTIREKPSSELKFTRLVATGSEAGWISMDKYRSAVREYGDRPLSLQMMLKFVQGPPTGPQALAAHITGKLAEAKGLLDDAGAQANAQKPAAAAASNTEINVVYVADVDVMDWLFLRFRARPDEDPEAIRWQFENVVFLLNIVDMLAGENDNIAIRKHKPKYYTLRQVELQAEAARNAENEKQLSFNEEYEKELNTEEEQTRQAYKALEDNYNAMVQRQQKGEDIDPNELKVVFQRLQSQQELANRRLEQRKKDLERNRDREVEKIRRETDRAVADIQFKYKLGAITFPPIPPLLVGVIVFTRRRLREREGISRNRMVK
jgi:ABC-2 type transport system permease protein